MKFLKFTIMLFLALHVLSCNEDDSSPIDTDADQNLLIGTWDLLEVTQNGTGTVTLEGIPINGNINAFGKNIDASMTISENPNIITASGSYTLEATASAAGQSITEDIPINLNEILNQSSWSLQSGVLTLTDASESFEVNIIELDATSLKIEFDYQDELIFQGFFNGAPVAIDTKVNMSFTKQ